MKKILSLLLTISVLGALASGPVYAEELLTDGTEELTIVSGSEETIIFAPENDEPGTGADAWAEDVEEDVEDDVDEDAEADAEEDAEAAEEAAVPEVSTGSFSNAAAITFGNTYSGQIKEDSNEEDYYRFTISSSGRVSLKVTFDMMWVYFKIYNTAGTEVWTRDASFDPDTNTGTSNVGIDLTKGSYYFVVCRDYSDGKYKFSMTFSSAGESFEETGNGTNNTRAAASLITAGKTYKGQIAVNDDTDYYKIVLSKSGTLAFQANAKTEWIKYLICDKDGKELWSDYIPEDEVTHESTMNKSLDLTAGTYYFGVFMDDEITGNYSFKATFTDAVESFPESGNGSNNSYASASVIELGKYYNGQIAVNDDKDFYKFVVPYNAVLSVKVTGEIDGMFVYIYNSSNNRIWDDYVSPYTEDGMCNFNEQVNLTKGTYYFAAESENTGVYTFRLSLPRQEATSITGFYNSVKGADLRWKKISGCSGYAVYRKRSADGTKKIATINNPNTVQYYDTGIREGCWGRVYVYFIYPIYGDKQGPKSNEVTLQRLAPMKFTKYTNSAAGKVSFTWACTAKDNKALGYEVQYALSKQDLFDRKGTFKKVSITGRNNLSRTITGFTKGKTYYFRIRCYVDYTHSQTGAKTKTWSQYSDVVQVQIKK